LAILSNVYVLH